MRVGVLECDHVDDGFTSIGGDYFDMFQRLLPTLDLVRYDAVGDMLPATPDECDGWIVTGSRYSAYDQMPWIERLGAFVGDVHRAGTPLVGICFGHQVLAHFTGGRCEKAAVWGVGAHDMTTGPRARLLYMHQDQVTALPDDGSTIGGTDHCPNGIIRVGPSMLGIQAHPEFPGAYVEALLHAREERIGHDVVKAALESLDAPRDEPVAVDWMLRTLTS